jgi:hypothetical protein
MTVTREELAAKWRDAALAGPGGREWRAVALSARSPLAFLAGVREPDGRIALLLEAPLDAAPAAPFRLHAEGVSVSDQRRPDEALFRLAVTLEREELRDVFEVLVLDVIAIASAAASPAAAARDVARRLEAWQACLRRRRARLSREQQTGLMGELEVLRLVAAEIGHAPAVDAWLGPLDGLHDFSREGKAIEVKSILGVGHTFRVSEAGQLETAGLTRLVVARPRFQEAPDGRSLADMVAALREEFRRDAASALGMLDDKLLRAGFIESEAGDGARAVLHDLYAFDVAEGFPRITAGSIPPGILDLSYTLDERALARFRIDVDALRRFARTMGGSAPS